MSTWILELEKLKKFWCGRYADCENESQRTNTRQEFSEALAKFYGSGSKSSDPDITDEVKVELNE